LPGRTLSPTTSIAAAWVPYAAARLRVFSSSSLWQLEQTLRSTWYGTPARCRMAWIVTALCLW